MKLMFTLALVLAVAACGLMASALTVPPREGAAAQALELPAPAPGVSSYWYGRPN
jgi:hypothetical protein